MLKRPRLLFAFLVVAVLAVRVCGIAATQTEADKHFRNAVEMQRAGKLDQALEEFRKVTQLQPKAAAPPGVNKLAITRIVLNR